MDAPDTTDARPGLRLRITGLVVIVLFALLGLRLWALAGPPGPGGGPGGGGQPDPGGGGRAHPGVILDRYDNPLVTNQVTEQITLSRVAAARTRR